MHDVAMLFFPPSASKLVAFKMCMNYFNEKIHTTLIRYIKSSSSIKGHWRTRPQPVDAISSCL